MNDSIYHHLTSLNKRPFKNNGKGGRTSQFCFEDIEGSKVIEEDNGTFALYISDLNEVFIMMKGSGLKRLNLYTISEYETLCKILGI